MSRFLRLIHRSFDFRHHNRRWLEARPELHRCSWAAPAEELVRSSGELAEPGSHILVEQAEGSRTPVAAQSGGNRSLDGPVDFARRPVGMGEGVRIAPVGRAEEVCIVAAGLVVGVRIVAAGLAEEVHKAGMQPGVVVCIVVGLAAMARSSEELGTALSPRHRNLLRHRTGCHHNCLLRKSMQFSNV